MSPPAVPPGPRRLLLGLPQLWQMRRDLMAHAAALQREYGDAAAWRIGWLDVYQFTHPDQIRQVLVEHNRSFQKPARFRTVLGRWNGNGLLLNEGKSWARQRRLVQPAFAPGRLRSYGDLILRQTGELFDQLAGQTFDIMPVLHRLTFRVTAEALFGADVAPVADEFLAAVDVLQTDAIGDFSALYVTPLWTPTPSRRRLRQAVGVVDRLVKQFIAARRRTGQDRGDLLSMLLLAVDEDSGDGMTDQQARDESVNLLLGGNETTATALVWACYLLARHEEFQEQLHWEIDRVTGGRPPRAEQLSEFVLIDAALREAMRLYPPAYLLSREAIEPVIVGDYPIQPGSQVSLPIFLTHRDARWFDRPDDFVPHRFTGEGEELWPACAYAPFGAGPRACIGRGFAMLEGVLVLAALLQKYQLRLAEGQGAPEVEAEVSLHPKHGVRVVMSPR